MVNVMLVLTLRRSSCYITENMPPSKKLKTSKAGSEKEREPVSKAELDSLEDFGGDWRTQCKNGQEIYRYAFYKDILTDVKFNVGEESVVFHAHRLILALRSPVFQAMFFGALAEKEDTITIPDIAAAGFHNLLRFIYFDHISFQNGIIAFKTFFAADKYCVSHLKDACVAYLCSAELMPSNVWIYFEGCQYLNSPAFENRCLAFLQHNTEGALQHNSFLDVSTQTLEKFLSMDSLNISEMELLLNVVRWAENKSNAVPENCLQNTLMPFLKFIRFGALTAAQFISFLESEKLKDILKERDALDILKHIIQPSSCALPDWCCTKTWRNSVDRNKHKPDVGACSAGKSEVTLKRKKTRKCNQEVSPNNSASSSGESSYVSTSLSSQSSSKLRFWNNMYKAAYLFDGTSSSSTSSSESSSSSSSESGTESDL